MADNQSGDGSTSAPNVLKVLELPPACYPWLMRRLITPATIPFLHISSRDLDKAVQSLGDFGMSGTLEWDCSCNERIESLRENARDLFTGYYGAFNWPPKVDGLGELMMRLDAHLERMESFARGYRELMKSFRGVFYDHISQEHEIPRALEVAEDFYDADFHDDEFKEMLEQVVRQVERDQGLIEEPLKIARVSTLDCSSNSPPINMDSRKFVKRPKNDPEGSLLLKAEANVTLSD
ncbi:hypothetical protein SCP_1400690 [Sparassis crispa]|uniref:Uncharacterized protein n=1 Tax=Sparassis crispa TaxID=139825 RepID=A0A401H2L7_9APHY|nr:hypothetical protein SCP_1400690 [Sparassis crispa]GBE88664.1 hypothetical protein SCP_1400690 [Sparassis crispa]